MRGEFGTAVTCPLFKLLEKAEGEESRMANLTGDSWNQLTDWLGAINLLREGMAGNAA